MPIHDTIAAAMPKVTALRCVERALFRWVWHAMFGDCDNCGHSFVYHVPLAGCAKCGCEELR